MKWGVRRYQNADGSLTQAGKLRYNSSGNHSSSAGGSYSGGTLSLNEDQIYNAYSSAKKKLESLEAKYKKDKDDYDITRSYIATHANTSVKKILLGRLDKAWREYSEKYESILSPVRSFAILANSANKDRSLVNDKYQRALTEYNLAMKREATMNASADFKSFKSHFSYNYTGQTDLRDFMKKNNYYK